jgi:hypothetical protein
MAPATATLATAADTATEAAALATAAMLAKTDLAAAA